jgi:hypothetical protein
MDWAKIVSLTDIRVCPLATIYACHYLHDVRHKLTVTVSLMINAPFADDQRGEIFCPTILMQAQSSLLCGIPQLCQNHGIPQLRVDAKRAYSQPSACNSINLSFYEYNVIAQVTAFAANGLNMFWPKTTVGELPALSDGDSLTCQPTIYLDSLISKFDCLFYIPPVYSMSSELVFRCDGSLAFS